MPHRLCARSARGALRLMLKARSLQGGPFLAGVRQARHVQPLRRQAMLRLHSPKPFALKMCNGPRSRRHLILPLSGGIKPLCGKVARLSRHIRATQPCRTVCHFHGHIVHVFLRLETGAQAWQSRLQRACGKMANDTLRDAPAMSAAQIAAATAFAAAAHF